LWFDTAAKSYGLEEEPGYTDKDPDAVTIKLDENLQIQIPEDDSSTSLTATAMKDGPHAGMPQISFLPDGTIAETSPRTVKIVDADGPTLSLTQTRDRNDYEIATNTNP
jgi:hypothetical protein